MIAKGVTTAIETAQADNNAGGGCETKGNENGGVPPEAGQAVEAQTDGDKAGAGQRGIPR